MKNSIITVEWIERAKRAGACDEALEWLREKPRTLTVMARRHPDYVVWAYARLPEAREQIDFATSLLAINLLTECARREPRVALLSVAEHLPIDVLIECARREPQTAMLSVAERLPLDVLIECARREPRVALIKVAALLPPEVLAELARREPYPAMLYAADVLLSKLKVKLEELP